MVHFRFEFRRSADDRQLPADGQNVVHTSHPPDTSTTEVYPCESHLVYSLMNFTRFPTFRPCFRACRYKTDVNIDMNSTVFENSENL